MRPPMSLTKGKTMKNLVPDAFTHWPARHTYCPCGARLDSKHDLDCDACQQKEQARKWAAGKSYGCIARECAVSKSLVAQIVRRESWV
jgi:hypothetical protein